MPPSISPAGPRPPSSRVGDPMSRRLRRAESLPPPTVPNLDDNANTFTEDNRLPHNPKQWSVDNLISFIVTSFKASNELSAADQEHMLHTINERKITGRDFLRLPDTDLTSLSLPQRLYLLKASRELRADILCGRPYHYNHSKDVYAQPLASSRPPFNDRLYDLTLSPPACIGADAELPLSLAMTLNCSNSVSDDSAQRYQDLARMRIKRRGKVKGLVETWERGSVSGSEGSISGSDVESDSDIPSTESSSSSSLSNSTGSLSNPPPPYASFKENEDEPTVEELLISAGPIKGARAWEEDYGLGKTVKRIPTGAPAPLPLAPLPPKMAEGVGIHVDSTECSVNHTFSSLYVTGSGRANKQKRVVTAIFTGRSDSVSEIKSVDEMPQASISLGDIRIESKIDVAAAEPVARPEDVFLSPAEVAEPSSVDNTVIASLEASIANTWAQLEALEARLEVVEAQIATQETANQAQIQPEYALQPLAEYQPVQTCIHAPVLDADNFTFSGYSLGLKKFTRSIIARTMGWIYPYTRPRPEARTSRSREASPSPGQPRLSPAFRLSNVIMLSFVLCAVILRGVPLRRGFWKR